MNRDFAPRSVNNIVTDAPEHNSVEDLLANNDFSFMKPYGSGVLSPAEIIEETRGAKAKATKKKAPRAAPAAAVATTEKIVEDCSVKTDKLKAKAPVKTETPKTVKPVKIEKTEKAEKPKKVKVEVDVTQRQESSADAQPETYNFENIKAKVLETGTSYLQTGERVFKNGMSGLTEQSKKGRVQIEEWYAQSKDVVGEKSTQLGEFIKSNPLLFVVLLACGGAASVFLGVLGLLLSVYLLIVSGAVTALLLVGFSAFCFFAVLTCWVGLFLVAGGSSIYMPYLIYQKFRKGRTKTEKTK